MGVNVGGGFYTSILPYTGSSLKVITTYATGNSVEWQMTNNIDGVDNSAMIKLLNGNVVPYSQILYTTAVKKRLTSFYFVGKDANNDDMIIYPDSASKWFTSSVLDPATINPNTGAPIKEGDAIEVGLDYYHDTTIVSVVKKADNGQLRAESKSVEVGYYYQAPYTYSFNYQFNSAVPLPGVIPDAENLAAVLHVNLGGGLYIYYPVPNGFEDNIISATIASKSSITQDDGKIFISYCGRFLDSVHVAQNSIYPCYSNNSYFQNVPTATDFLFSVACTQQKKVIYPSYFTQVYAQSGNTNSYFYCNIVNGKWSTRGLTPGAKYNFAGYVGGYYVTPDSAITITPGLDSLSIPLKGDENICKLAD